MKMTKRQKYLVSCLLAILFACFGVGIKTQGASWINRVQSHKTEQAITGKQDHKEVSKTNNSSTAPYSQDQYDQLANLDFQSGGNAILNVNNGQSMLNIDNWKENKVIYGELDPLNRTTFVTAYLDKKNLGRSEGRERQVWKPTGWHQKKVDGKEIYNRGHLLAYTSSFNFDMDGNYKEGEIGSQDNPKNLATQTAFSNQKVQTYYEKLVRDAQKIKGNKVIYQIVTVFRGKELMPRGYWLQAIDSAGTLNFNVYEYNVQPNVVFNYEDGTSKIERTMKVSWES
ncbi:TPA: DNA/RNA non-specific endonuclease [Enterococcus faecalis]|nr:DNA/RNA non-specific endonuclease [Enterococcus faecalis]EIW2162772.1 DNA/RNA non-specific endonuclease [Enterococcus faecalis]EKC6686306.1 DNA/RNA non-specific endonuclease [Enterococcus faecalis]MDU2475993.1 DNA/RNA non-specific endonuclease [Enterococcus faecalis]MDU3972557.1 DNA/RNA non-specific endonuclease [Enterococcus faecalis]MDU6500318.1 DNA/RNA non-specific endonuclease [Enterococcus faecalis]